MSVSRNEKGILLILESVNMLARVKIPEYLAVFLENKNEGFGVSGQRTEKLCFTVTGGKGAACIGYCSGTQLSLVNKMHMLETEKQGKEEAGVPDSYFMVQLLPCLLRRNDRKSGLYLILYYF